MPANRNLYATRYSAEYQQRLNDALYLFLAFVSRQPAVRQFAWEIRPTVANTLLVAFIQALYEKDKVKNRSVARHSILAVQKRYGKLRGKLHEAWETLDSWTQEVPGTLRTPILLPILLGASMLSKIWAMGTSGLDAYLWLGMGVLCEVGFFGLLRPREILNLKVGDLAFPSNLLSVAASYCIAKIVNPKNRRQLGKVQFAVIRSERALSLIHI